MSEYLDPDNTETAKCPWCGEERLIVPHPKKPGREAAFCTCRSDRRQFLDRAIQARPHRKKSEVQKESEL